MGVGQDYSDVQLDHLYVDTAAMRLVADPRIFDVLLTENMFGDILSDEAAVLVGSLGLLPSASLGDGPGLFEPIHGSAPDIAGRDLANPIGAIATVAMLLRHGLAVADVELEYAPVGVDRDRVPVFDERDGAADRRLGRDVADDVTVGPA